ncbi:MAG: OsmC family protein [Rhodothermales bacterium]|nr:OsmC family protein [Rhodothermales bacterium]
MRVSLTRLDDAFHLVGRNADGLETHFDVTEGEGGANAAPGPMQTTAMALGACASIDVILILGKQRQEIDSFDVEVDYERATERTPAVFTTMHVHFILTGVLDAAKVRRAVALSIGKYCSVAAMLARTADITASCTVNGEHYEHVERNQ